MGNPPRRHWGWAAAIAALVLLLAGQLDHHNRQALVAKPWLEKPLQWVYGLFGVELEPRLEPRRLRPGPARRRALALNSTTLVLRASVHNRAARRPAATADPRAAAGSLRQHADHHRRAAGRLPEESPRRRAWRRTSGWMPNCTWRIRTARPRAGSWMPACRTATARSTAPTKPVSFSIGPWQIPARALLAPMAGVTDRPFRILCRQFGAGLAASEMITADQRPVAHRKTRQRMNHEGEPEPRVVQLAGNDPRQLADAARANVDLGAQIIDINLGCPAKKVYGKLCGSALLGDPLLAGRLLEAVVAAVTVPVTVKIRTGIDRAHINAVEISRIAAAAGVSAIAVHGRTRMDFYEGEAEYATIREVAARGAHSGDCQRRY